MQMDKINGNCRNFVLACDLLGWAYLFIGNFCSLLYGAVNKNDETSWLNLGFPYVANLVVISHKWVLILRLKVKILESVMLKSGLINLRNNRTDIDCCLKLEIVVLWLKIRYLSCADFSDTIKACVTCVEVW